MARVKICHGCCANINHHYISNSHTHTYSTRLAICKNLAVEAIPHLRKIMNYIRLSSLPPPPFFYICWACCAPQSSNSAWASQWAHCLKACSDGILSSHVLASGWGKERRNKSLLHYHPPAIHFSAYRKLWVTVSVWHTLSLLFFEEALLPTGKGYISSSLTTIGFPVFSKEKKGGWEGGEAFIGCFHKAFFF